MGAKRKRRITIVSILVLLVAIVGAVAVKANSKDKKPPESPIKTGKTEVADIQVKVTEVGTVEPEVKVEVKSAISGKVVEIKHRDGDVVQRGETLARVEPDLNQAQSLAETKNSLASAEIRFEETKKNFEADNKLFMQGLLAPKQNRETAPRHRSRIHAGAPGIREGPREIRARRKERHSHQPVRAELPGLQRRRADERRG